jgi:Ca2+-binding RTX toxin-like protein
MSRIWVVAALVLVASTASATPAGAAITQATWGIEIDNTEITILPRSTYPEYERRLRIGPYLNSVGQLEPAAPWKYHLISGTDQTGEQLTMVDDGDGKDDMALGRAGEGLGDEPNENCQFYKVNGEGGTGQVGAKVWRIVRCKVLTSVNDPGYLGIDTMSMQLQKDAPKLNVNVLGGPATDRIEIGPRVSGVVDGGEGESDLLYIGSAGETVDWDVDMVGGTANSSALDKLTIGGFENFDGSYANSDNVSGFFSPSYTVAGTNGPNRIDTVGGDDEIVAGGGDDMIDASGSHYYGNPTDRNDIDAGPGHDDVRAGFGADVVLGGTGNDKIDTPGGADEIDAGPGDDYVKIGQQTLKDADNDGIDDQLAADVTVRGGDGKDDIYPSVFIDEEKPVGRFLVDGGPGDDKIRTSSGDDTITGGPGNDVIDCGAGDDSVIDVEAGDKLTNCEGKLEVLLKTADLPGSDLFTVTVELFNTTTAYVTGIFPKAGIGLVQVPDVFAVADAGAVIKMGDSGEMYPGALAPGARFTRTFTFLTVKPGRVLLQAEVEATRGDGSKSRDAEYADVGITAEDDDVSDTLERMGAIEAFSTSAYDTQVQSSREWATERAKRMRAALPAKAEKLWLGTSKGDPKVRRLDEAMAHMHGMSPEELATAVPRGDVIKKGGQRKIDEARRAVLNADSGKEEEQAKARLRRVRAAQTLTSSESMAAYNKARMQTDNNELFKIYDDYAEKPAKELWQAGGGVFKYLLNAGSYAGRQQIEADLIRFAELNDQSFREGMWVFSSPGESYTAVTEQFRENVEQAEVARSKREQLKRAYYLTDPEKAIYLKAQDDSWYAAQVLRYFVEEFTPSPSAKLLGKEITWGGKAAKSKSARASVVMAEAVKHGDATVGRQVYNGAEDLGEGVKHADDFIFPSADPKDLLKLDQIGKQGGAGIRDQRVAEQINREVTEDLKREFPGTDIEFNMFYRPKKDYEPVGALAKPQAFGEKTLDPRSIEILGAPADGLGKLVIFKPDHPASTKGWAGLSSIEKKADLDLYKLHLDQWVNFNKRKPAGKTADWKPALDKKTKIDFGGGHSVEVKLEKKKLGKDAYEIRATEMHVDGTQIHKGKPASIGGDLDPLMAINAKTGTKLKGEIERRALELWNQKSVKAQKELGFRSGGHGATGHGDDVTPAQWAKFAKYAAVHMTPDEQLVFEALVVARAGLPAGTKILPAGIKANEHLVRTTTSDTWLGPLGTVLD